MMTASTGFHRKLIRKNDNIDNFLDSSLKLMLAINKNCEICQNTSPIAYREYNGTQGFF